MCLKGTVLRYANEYGKPAMYLKPPREVRYERLHLLDLLVF